MNSEQPSNLRIVTSLIKAIELHPLTHYNSYSQSENGFLHGAKLIFHKPEFNKATFLLSGYAPQKEWFVLFDDAEKEIMEDEYRFYGICYETSVKLSLERLRKLIDKAQIALAVKTKPEANENQDWKVRTSFNYRDSLVEAKKALSCFDETDPITLTFIFSEFPNIKEAKRKDYVKEFEEKILKQVSQTK